jgi:type IV fimbrial biogenesis protein FimT
MNKNQGFTLVELMTALAIMVILFGIAIPSFKEVIKSNRLSTQANEFISTLNLARSEAIKRGDAITITATDPSAAGNEWGPGWTVTTSGGVVLIQNDGLHTGLTLDSTGNLSSFVYQGSGLINQGDTLNLCDDRTGETGRQITITITGRVSVSDVACP